MTNDTLSQDPRRAEDSNPGFRDWIWMFTEIFGYRELLWQMLLRDIRLRYKQAVMGFFWALFIPVMVIVSGSVLKYVMATISGQPLNTEAFTNMAVKAMGWSLFLGILNNGANSLLGNINLITKIYFPRETILIAGMCVQMFDTFIGSTVLFVLLASIGAICWTLNLLWVPVLTLLLISLALAIGLFLSCAMVFYRDIKYLLSVFTSFGIFFTPVFFEVNQIGGTLGTVMMLNPAAPLLEGLRLVITRGHDLLTPLNDAAGNMCWHPAFLLYAALFAIFGLIFAWRFFHLKEKLYAEYI
ncbi:MAG: ABC transporter permease [Thermoguttaceae bacterium]|nr:ABC transporter permease [Thermoguttaceae bacterium]